MRAELTPLDRPADGLPHRLDEDGAILAKLVPRHTV